MVQAGAMVAPANHDAYIANTLEPFRPLLERVRSVVSSALPDAEEVISYDMPGFKIGETVVVGYAAFARQCGLYCAPEAIAECAEALAGAGLKTTKTGVTFTPKRPIPDHLVVQLALASRRYAVS